MFRNQREREKSKINMHHTLLNYLNYIIRIREYMLVIKYLTNDF